MEAVKLPALAKPHVTLPANLYSGVYLLSHHLSLDRKSFVVTPDTKNLRTKIYMRLGRFYTVPPKEVSPADGYDWQHVGKLHGRDIYIATRTNVR